MNIDGVSEMKVSASAYSAEYAKGPVVVTVTSKSGTSTFHGTGYLYARDTNLNANDWYNNNLQQTRPEGRYLYPGGTLQGPVLFPHTISTRIETNFSSPSSLSITTSSSLRKL